MPYPPPLNNIHKRGLPSMSRLLLVVSQILRFLIPSGGQLPFHRRSVRRKTSKPGLLILLSTVATAKFQSNINVVIEMRK